MNIGEIRKELKVWERKFQDENGRKPSKMDIDNCIAIKELYIRYGHMKQGNTGSPRKLVAMKINEFNANVKSGGFSIISNTLKNNTSSTATSPASFLMAPLSKPYAFSTDQGHTCSRVNPAWLGANLWENESSEKKNHSLPDEDNSRNEKWSDVAQQVENNEIFPVDTPMFDEHHSSANYESLNEENSCVNIKAVKEISTKAKSDVNRIRIKKNASVSDANYVRLNMKCRTYKPRTRKITGSQYKRKMWKKYKNQSNGKNTQKYPRRNRWSQSSHSGRKAATSKIDVTEDNRIANSDVDPSSITKSEHQNHVDKERSSDGDQLPENVTHSNEGTSFIGLPRPISMPSKTRNVVQPYFQRDSGSEEQDAFIKFMDANLREFGYSNFREGQRQTIFRILCGLPTLAILPTGSGKSLCYQLPAYLYSKRSDCISLVISPLVSLMEDQVANFPAFLKGACLHTNLTKTQRKKVYMQLKEGKISVLLLSPETLVSASNDDCGEYLFSCLPPIAFACIDEIHCVAEWSHHFRPSYLLLCKVLKERLGVKCLLGLTATATTPTIKSVCTHLGITDFSHGVMKGICVPTNLRLSVSRDKYKDEALKILLGDSHFSYNNSIIIYCTKRDETERVAHVVRSYLLHQSLSSCGESTDEIDPEHGVEYYHAGMSPRQRKMVQKNFMSGHTKIVVATVAFGMGLNKPDVRGIIHYNLPKSFETFVQEIGRAGRDGLPAYCHVFLDEEGNDLRGLERHVYSNSVDAYAIKQFTNKIFPFCKCETQRALADANIKIDNKQKYSIGHELALPVNAVTLDLDLKEEVLNTLLCYLELHYHGWIYILRSLHSKCQITCSDKCWQRLVKSVPPIAAASRLGKVNRIHKRVPCYVFPYVEVADLMGWDSEPVRHDLLKLKWKTPPVGTNKFTKSEIDIDFIDYSFHIRVPCTLTDEDRDNICDYLLQVVQRRERDNLLNLRTIYAVMHSVAYPIISNCLKTSNLGTDCELKSIINEYFKSETPELLLESRNIDIDVHAPLLSYSDSIIDELRKDIRSFLSTFNEKFNGRSIARIFHGIHSPAYPADIWCRCKRFWKRHININFELVRNTATQELIRWRRD